MLVELQNNLNTIHTEIMNKLTPYNLKKNINLLNVDGAIAQGNKFDLIVHNGLKDIKIENLGGTYGFELNSNGYYESNNKGIDNSYALCKLSFNSNGNTEIQLECIDYAENNFDFGLISKLDTELSASYNIDSSDILEVNFKGQSKLEPQIITIPITEGNHFLYIKYRKDGSVSNFNDSFQFKILNTSYNELLNEIITIPYRSLSEMQEDLTQDINTIGVIFNENNEAIKAYKFDGNSWVLYQDIEGKTVYFTSIEEMELDKNYPENTMAILTGLDNNYIGTYKLISGNWVLLGVPSEEVKSIVTLNQVDGINLEYTGKGGTDSDIITELDYVLTGGTAVSSNLLFDNSATIENGLPNFTGTVNNNILEIGGNN